MGIDELDEVLDRFQDAAQAISANLFELDANPRWKLLQAGSLVGESASQQAEATKALADLWEWFRRFKDLLDRASAVRSKHSWLSATEVEAELAELLNGHSIDVGTIDIPLSQRNLLGNRASSTRCTPDQLLTLMSDAFERTQAVAATFGEAWEGSLPRIRASQEQLADLSETAGSLGQGSTAEWAPLRDRLDKLGELITRNPLSVQTSELERLELEIDGLRNELEAAGRLKIGLASELDSCRSLLDQLRAAALDAVEAYCDATEKIAGAQVQPPVGFDESLPEQLTRAEASCRDGRWLVAQRELADWIGRANASLRSLQQNLAANRAPIEQRNQLRGRLDAYHAKVGHLGLLEDPSLAALYQAAREALFTAPTDLDQAADLVRKYQRAVPAEPLPKAPA